MKNIFVTSLMSAFTLLFAFLFVGSTSAQAQVDPMSPIPADTAVRVGQLPNGMTYYIRHNAKPEKQAEFYIFHDVGAIQEDDSQIGLAHFLEHMAFNGTKNLPAKMLINYLETIGVKFGANLNAGTGQELTVYNMSSVPVTREGIIDSALLILHDWSYFISLLPEEIEKERGVIIEELRTGNTASFRLRNKTNPTLYNGSKYASRNVIGNEQALRSFSPDQLREFYHKWYRTDLQAIVVVGDIDVDQVEAKIKKVMSDIPSVPNPEAKTAYAIPDNAEPLITVASDPEQTRSEVTIYIKRRPLPREVNDKIAVAKLNTLLDFIAQMSNNRLYEITQKPDAPFVSAGIGQGQLTSTADVVMGRAIAREGEIAKAFEALYSEIEKIQRYGFTESELERVKSDMMRAAQQSYDNRKDKRSEDFVWDYINNYRNNDAMPSDKVRWQIDSAMIASTTIEDVNSLSPQIITDNNQVVIAISPEKEGIVVPTEQQIGQIIARVNSAEVEAYADNTVKEPLVTADLRGSKVKRTETDRFGATVWTLANGVKVIVKPTDFKTDELKMSVNARGGLSMLSDEDYPTGEMLSTYVDMSGVGKFSAVELSKQLAGKAVGIVPDIKSYENGFSGVASPKDAEVLLQLLYLAFTEPRFDQNDFNVMIDKFKAVLTNASKNPKYVLQDSLINTLYGHNPRRQMQSVKSLEKVSFEKMPQIYRRLYANPREFVFTFVGNIDLEQFKPLVEKYIGSIPVGKTKIDATDDRVAVVKGEVVNRFSIPMQAPKTTVYYTYTGELPYTLENSMTISAIKQILDIRCTESIREEKGGTYGVGVRGSLSDFPVQKYTLNLVFDTDPAMANELMPILEREIEKLATDGPSAEDLGKIKEFMMKQRPDDLKQNSVWLNFIDSYYINNIDLNSDYDKLLSELSADKIKALAVKIVSDRNVIKVIMDPRK